jgi:hypothetical protein
MAHYTVEMPNVASEVFDGEVVVADFVEGTYFSLTGTAALIWQGLRAGQSTEGIADWLGGHFRLPPQTITPAIEDFVVRLVEAGLAAPLDRAPPQQLLPEIAVADFAAPVLERHDDLKDLLLLDPVHDVSEAGWPHLPDKDTA